MNEQQTDTQAQVQTEAQVPAAPKVSAEAIKALRNALKMNQKEFAAALGVSQTMVSFLEAGSRHMAQEQQEKFAALSESAKG